MPYASKASIWFNVTLLNEQEPKSLHQYISPEPASRFRYFSLRTMCTTAKDGVLSRFFAPGKFGRLRHRSRSCR